MNAFFRLMPLLLSLVLACEHRVGTITTGSHDRTDSLAQDRIGQRYAIWSSFPGVADALTADFLSAGQIVVERAKLNQIFEEQRIRLIQASDADVLHVGHLAGANQVIFADVHVERMGSWATAPVRISVAVRSVEVESGTVRWSGTAAHDEPITSSPELSASYLVRVAWRRALCPLERGATWTEPSGSRAGGCVLPSGQSSGSAAAFGGQRQDPVMQQEATALLQEEAWMQQEYAALQQAKSILERERATVPPGDPAALTAYNARLQAYQARVKAYDTRRVAFQQRLDAYKTRTEAGMPH